MSIKFLATLFVGLLSFSFSDHSEKAKTQVLLLGSYHMSNPGLDVLNQTSDDVLAPTRQAEIEQLVKKIAKFKPTKIAVEVTINSKMDTLLQANYAQYLQGNYTLKRNESEQIGFRLAKLLGHAKIYAINSTGDFDMNKVMGFAMNNGMKDEAQSLMQEMQLFMKQENEALAKSTILEHFRHMNSAAFIEKNWQVYQMFLKFNNGKIYAGADLFADNYKRNLKIVSNLLKETGPSEERILVIYGAGHIPFFKNILTGYPDLEIVNALKFLK